MKHLYFTSFRLYPLLIIIIGLNNSYSQDIYSQIENEQNKITTYIRLQDSLVGEIAYILDQRKQQSNVNDLWRSSRDESTPLYEAKVAYIDGYNFSERGQGPYVSSIQTGSQILQPAQPDFRSDPSFSREDFIKQMELISNNLAKLNQSLYHYRSNLQVIRNAYRYVNVDYMARVYREKDSLAFVADSRKSLLESYSRTLVEQSLYIEELERKYYTAYYIMGNAAELERLGIIKSKGLLGNGYQLSENFSEEYFEKIDTRESFSIPFSGQQTQILSLHPQNAYTLNSNDHSGVDSLEIIKPESFWRISRHLIILTQE